MSKDRKTCKTCKKFTMIIKRSVPTVTLETILKAHSLKVEPLKVEPLKAHSLKVEPLKVEPLKAVSSPNVFSHKCVFKMLVDSRICSVCDKKFVNGIPVVDDKYIKEKEFCDSRIQEFYNRSMTQQKSKEWLNARYECITASVVAKITNNYKSKTLQSMIMEKAHYGKYSKNIKNVYTTYGELYEPLANMVYSYRTNTITHDFGLIKHPIYSFIGASTDGVTDGLINIEIKCPTSRIVDGHISRLYYEQMQLQMEVLNLDITHFFECNFITHTYEEFIVLDTTNEKGIIIEFLKDEIAELDYLYMPLGFHDNIDSVMAWKNNNVQDLIENNCIITDVIFWSLLRMNCNEVKRDKNWFAEKLPLLETFWNMVLEERKIPELEKGICMI